MNNERRKQIDRLRTEVDMCLDAFKDIRQEVCGKSKRKAKKADMIIEKLSDAVSELDQIY